MLKRDLLDWDQREFNVLKMRYQSSVDVLSVYEKKQLPAPLVAIG